MTAPLDLAALRALPRDMRPRCSELHHEPADYHEDGGQCPVAFRIVSALNHIPALLDELEGLRADAMTMALCLFNETTVEGRPATDAEKYAGFQTMVSEVRREMAALDRARGEGRTDA